MGGAIECPLCGQNQAYCKCTRLEKEQCLEIRRLRWIPVSEKLPEPFELVITYVCQATVALVKGGYYHDGSDPELQPGMTADQLRGWWHERSSVGTEKLEGHFAPTHWMHMPEVK
jgi:hypothetical protein